MVEGYARVSVSSDKTKEMFENLKALTQVDVLVGIPEEKSSREDEGINNAELAFIHTQGIRSKSMRNEMDESKPYNEALQMYLEEHGSPLWHSPPRPMIEPAIEDPDNQKILSEQLRQAADDALSGDFDAMNTDLEKAGMLGQNLVRDWFTNPKNGWEPNSPLTVEQKGSDNPMIDTGELRKSISYVVRKK
ncbi:hypothetical protein JCM15765_03880 [Paradesulfitobacterium aromaticivorans]